MIVVNLEKKKKKVIFVSFLTQVISKVLKTAIYSMVCALNANHLRNSYFFHDPCTKFAFFL